MRKTKDILIPYFLATLIFLFVSLPLLHRYLEQRAILVIEGKELEREDAHVAEIIRAEGELIPYVLILNEIRKGLPGDASLPSVIRYLETVTIDSGLNLASIGPFSTTESPERDNLKETALDMTVISNNYSSIKSLMRELERSIKLINIVSATITPIVGEEGELRFSLSLSLKTYSY